MYCHLTDPAVKNVAVLDMTHGGFAIAHKLKKLGLNVAAVDVYGTLSPDQRNFLEMDGIQVPEKDYPVEVFDLVVSPVHLHPENIMLENARKKHVPIISHHRAVGEILSIMDMGENLLVIEVTGTKAKTSTASLLADMISRCSVVVLHTSRGLELWEDGVCQLVHKGLSITPGSILQAVDIANSLGKKIEAYIFEVSLGFTGYSDVGIITTLDMDYIIAGKTSMASEAKVRSILNYPEDVLIVLNENCKRALHDMKQPLESKHIRTFSFLDRMKEKKNVADYCFNIHHDLFSLECIDKLVEARLLSGYDAKSYLTAFGASCVAALEIGIPWKTVKEVIQQFRGLQGRMQEMLIEDIRIMDNSNSGMDIFSVEKALDLCFKKEARIVMVLGEEAAQVCEGLPPEDVIGFLSRWLENIDELILVGERMKPLVCGRIRYAQSLDCGKTYAMELAKAMGSSDVIIALCVKCFR